MIYITLQLFVIVFQDLRHTYAVNVLRAGEYVKTIQNYTEKTLWF